MSERRDVLLQRLQESDRPLSANALAKELKVSRQIIVGDVALLRAKGMDIVATPRGYLYERHKQEGIYRTIAVSHSMEQLKDELYTIVDQGGTLIDVIVEHPVYGELLGNLHISSRYDADEFLCKLEKDKARPLSNLTDGLHLHTIQCRDEEGLKRILDALQAKGFLYKK